jgi:hypothetical protein
MNRICQELGFHTRRTYRQKQGRGQRLRTIEEKAAMLHPMVRRGTER